MVDQEKIQNGVKLILEGLGEDITREGLLDTPRRVAKFYAEWKKETEAFNLTSFTASYDNMVIVKDIPFYSLCEHHVLPFFGKAHIGYVPNGKVLGLSKIVRILNKHSKRLQIQEKLCCDISEELHKSISPKGVMVVLEAEHLCMNMRGIKTIGSKTITSSLRGVFKYQKVREEFLNLIKS